MSLSAIRSVSQSIEAATRSAEFVTVCAYIMRARGDITYAREMAKGKVSSAVFDILQRSAVNPGLLSDASQSAISPLANGVAAWLGTLRNVSVFDTMYPSMRQVPLRSRVGTVTSGATAGKVGPASVTLMTSIALENNQLDELKALAIVAMSDEVLKLGVSGAEGVLNDELRSAVGLVTDTELLSILTTGASSSASTGSTAAAIRIDLSEIYSAMNPTARSRFFAIASPRNVLKWSLDNEEDSGTLFENVNYNGGNLKGVEIIASDAVTASQIVCVDAFKVAANLGGIAIDASNEADAQFVDNPGSPSTASTVMRSLWQSNLVALRALRWFGAQKLSSDACRIISNASYGDSP